MLLKFCLSLFSIIPLLAHSQDIGQWKLYLNQEEIASAKDDSVQTVQIHKSANATMKFVFAEGDTAFVRKVIVMNEQRSGIDSRKIAGQAQEVIFNTQELYRQSAGKPLHFYIVKIPADPARAALVRVSPRLFCQLQWID